MSTRLAWSFGTSFACLIALVSLLGCGPTPSSAPPPTKNAASTHEHADHEHADHEHASDEQAAVPGDFRARVAEIGLQHAAIREALGAKDTDSAHERLHRIGLLLEEPPKWTGQAGLSEPDQAAAQSAAGTLFEIYSEIDGDAHKGKAIDFAPVAEKLDQAMAELKAVAERQTAQP